MFRFFENLLDPFADYGDGAPARGFWPYMRQQLRPYRRLLPIMAVTSFLAALIESGLIYYSGRLVDLMTAAGRQELVEQHGVELAIAALCVLLIRPATIVANMLMLNQVLAGSLRDRTRWSAHDHLIGQSRRFFADDFAGRLANRVMQVGPAVEDNAFTFFEALWYATIFFFSSLVIMAGFHPLLILPMLIWLGLYAVFVLRTGAKVAVASERMSESRSMVTARVVDAYTNIETVKLFANDARERGYAQSAMRRDRLRFLQFLRIMTNMSAGLSGLTGLLVVGVVGTAVWLWLQGAISIGETAAAAALVLRLQGFTGWIMWVTIIMFENAGKVRETLQSLEAEVSVTDAAAAPALAVPKGRIEFDGLTHHYGKETGGLNGVSFTVAPGEKVGLVGRSGAGKTTLVNLLLRFMDPEQGRVLIDGQNVRSVTQMSLRDAIGMVSQEPGLMHRSVRDNILLGKPDATEAEIAKAIARADAAGFIPDLRDPKGREGLDAHVGERGVKLSGGQRQRIALSRVILKNAPILVLDEATSALDSESEAVIQEALYGVMEGKTVIAIAHRLSTLARMDRIVVLDQGKVIEEGNHTELLEAGGLYATLWARQSGGFIAQEAAQ